MQHEALGRSWLFKGLSEDEVGKLLNDVSHVVRGFRKGEVIFQPLMPARWAGVILKGSVQSFKLFPNGNQVNVAVREAGDLIGPAAALSAQRQYPSGVAALTDAEVLMFRREDFLRLLRSDARLAENALGEMSSIVYLLQQRLELLSYHGIAQRIAFFLLNESLQSGKPAVPIPGSMTKWASMMNMSRPSLHRELRKIEEQGAVRVASSEIEIVDRVVLEGILRE